MRSMPTPAEEPLGGTGVTPGLDKNVEDVAVLVHGAPEVVDLSVDLDEDLVHVLPNLEVKRRW
ncbi:hypothetical protein ABIE67_009761 [Streptomyces sp. V4I8]